MSNEIPRRARIDLYTPAELAIRDALIAVEAVGADERLTEAVNFLDLAQEHVANYVDGIHSSRCRCYSCRANDLV
jgi:hypothetical protein